MSYYQISRQPTDERDLNKLMGQFLVRLELLRLTEIHGTGNGTGSNKAEYMLMKENEMLRAKLHTYKDNILVLQKLIDQVRGGAQSRSVVTF